MHVLHAPSRTCTRTILQVVQRERQYGASVAIIIIIIFCFCRCFYYCYYSCCFVFVILLLLLLQLMLRKQIVNMVLDTDLARHFSSLAKFKQRIKAATATVGGPNVLSNVMGDNDGRLMTMCMIMKTADIAHAAKPWVLHEKWSKRILLEFFAQGDAERRRGMPVSSLCDRETTDAWKAQTGFIDFLAMPLFEATATLLRDFEGSEEEWRASSRIYQDVVIGSKTNRETWAKKEAAGESQYKYKDQEALRSTLFELELGK